MKTLRERDTDGTPVYYAGDVPGGLRAYHQKMLAEARRLGCRILDIPQLGSKAPGPFHARYKVKRDADGMIIRIETR